MLPSSDTTRDDDQGRVRSFPGVVESRKVGLPDLQSAGIRAADGPCVIATSRQDRPPRLRTGPGSKRLVWAAANAEGDVMCSMTCLVSIVDVRRGPADEVNLPRLA